MVTTKTLQSFPDTTEDHRGTRRPTGMRALTFLFIP
jgi:hypothetical protein